MGQVKFNVDVVDSDSQIRYVASDDFVEVSDSFFKRLKSSDMYGKSFVSDEDADEFDDDDSIDTGDYSKEELAAQFKLHLDGIEAEHQSEIEGLKSDLDEANSHIQQLKDDKEAILNESSHFESELARVNAEMETLKATPNPDAEKQLVRDEYELLLGSKPGNKSIETMKAEIESFKAQ